MIRRLLLSTATASSVSATRYASRLTTLKSSDGTSYTHNMDRFTLDGRFVGQFAYQKPKFGFNGLGELVYRRTYSRIKDDGHNEEWYETVARVVQGTFRMQKDWILAQNLHWDEQLAQEQAQEMYKRIFDMKFLPPGRGLWAMGSPLTEERKLYAALNNCAFVSTEDLDSTFSEPFSFLMDASMLGVGVGFDTKGAGKLMVKGVDYELEPVKFVIPDSREGWVEALKTTLDAHFHGKALPSFDFSQIRKAGEPIRGFGGISSGPEALQHLLDEVTRVLENHKGRFLSVTGIVDIMNYIGKCVVAGNVRRTAEIAFGDPKLPEYLDLKDYSKNPSRVAFGWTSNNSVFAELGMEYADICERIKNNGEPGFAWLENMQKFGRLSDPPNFKDLRASGGNPCLEQTLESYELCCLVETFPDKHEDLDDFLETLRYAFLYAKTVTLGTTHWPQSNAVMLRNRRIGCSMSGIAQFITNRGLHELKRWSREGYAFTEELDRQFSERFCIPESIKRTSIKPSGTVSLLVGATPGMHYPESRFYIRRVRLSKNSDLLTPLKNAGYLIEDAVGQSDTVVVEIPVDCGAGIRTLNDVSIWEQVSLAAFLQEHWSDNQVSCTVTFDPEKESKELEHVLNYFQYKLKGISFLPKLSHGAYPQMPYEAITEEQYLDRISKIDTSVSLRFIDRSSADFVPDRFCDSNACAVNEQ